MPAAVWRLVHPIPEPASDTADDICSIELVPFDKLYEWYRRLVPTVLGATGTIVHMEFGVFNGTSIASAFHAYRSLGMDFRLIAFDSFQGLPPEAESCDDGVWKAGKYQCSRSQMETCLEARDVDVSKVEIVEGWYKHTLNQQTLDLLGIHRTDVIFVDCDTYLSCREVLQFVSGLISDQALVCFDDWRLHDLDLYDLGEKKAYKELLEEGEFLSTALKSYNRKSQAFIVSRDSKEKIDGN